MGKTRVAVLFGGKTCEHDVSIISGLQALRALNADKYEGFPVYLTREGAWYVGEGLRETEAFRRFDKTKAERVLPSGEDGKLVLRAWPDGRGRLFTRGCEVVKTADVVLPVMHGLNGEDGTLQGMLELFGVPYASSGVLGSALGMDKIAMKAFFRGCGFPVVESEWFDRAEWAEAREALLDRLEKALPYPMFVKPANLGSSIGISRAVDRESLAAGICAGEGSEPDTVRMKLRPGSLAIIASDGVLMEDDDRWLRAIMQGFEGDDTKQLAKAALQGAVREYGCQDDMTVLAVKVDLRV